MNTPIALIAFNRPQQTQTVFDAIRAAKPQRLFIIVDGPRENHPTDAERCEQVRALLEKIDWPCELTRIYSDANLGCRERVSSGISAVFEAVDRCIFLEDDCLPEPTFFRYCAELLDRYEHDERVMSISGDSFQTAMGSMEFSESYFFTRYSHVWGWATWRRAWQHYEGVLGRWPQLRDSGLLNDRLGNLHQRIFWTRWLDKCARGDLNTWDVPWQLAIFEAGESSGLSICPSVNLVSNIGMDEQGTHHTGESDMGELPTHPMPFPMTHPAQIERNAAADRWAERHIYSGSLLARYHRVWRHAKSSLRLRFSERSKTRKL
ncbi:MAG: hypothetical protein ACI89L_000329 [Phycisphaerales bacterium]|jgi:hypothetical protein